MVEQPSGASILQAGLVISAYYVVNAVLTAIALSLASNRGLFYVLRTNSGSTLVPDIAGAALGILVAIIWLVMPHWTFLLALPGALVAKAQSTIRSLEAETISVVSHLAELLDARDPSTHEHSSRVAENATRLAVAMGLDDGQVDLIELAGRVHDLGKIAVKDAVLLKPGPLDERERAEIQRHAHLGAAIVERFSLYREGARLVRSHHERWDGKGYPDGLSGERIPIGARVIAVADSFDAMTSDRPYRLGMAPAEAIAELERGAGSQWDPTVVRCFVDVLLQEALAGATNIEEPHKGSRRHPTRRRHVAHG